MASMSPPGTECASSAPQRRVMRTATPRSLSKSHQDCLNAGIAGASGRRHGVLELRAALPDRDLPPQKWPRSCAKIEAGAEDICKARSGVRRSRWGPRSSFAWVLGHTIPGSQGLALVRTGHGLERESIRRGAPVGRPLRRLHCRWSPQEATSHGRRPFGIAPVCDRSQRSTLFPLRPDALDNCVRRLSRPSQSNPRRSSLSQRLPRALTDELPLELRERCHHVRHHLAAWRGSVYAEIQGDECPPFLTGRFHQAREIQQGAT